MIINVARLSEVYKQDEGLQLAPTRESPINRLTYCITELDQELSSLSPSAPCEAILSARTELSSLKSLLSQLQSDYHLRLAEVLSESRDRPKAGSYQGVIQELLEEREKLEKEIDDLGRREKQGKGRKVASLASGGRWLAED